jgi:hypothetical protein
MMNKNVLILTASVCLVAVLTLSINFGNRKRVARIEDSPAGSFRIAEPAYTRLANEAQSGDCQAAYRLARHHIFFTLNTNEAVRWYRLASKCPYAPAKGELAGILMHFDSYDAEVDRLLSEIEELDLKAAEKDRAAVKSVRASRAPQAP